MKSYIEGYRAVIRELSTTDVPYPKKTKECIDWLEGFNDALTDTKQKAESLYKQGQS